MPYVRVLLSAHARDEELIRRLHVDLPKIVADALAIPPSAAFPPSEVTIDGAFLAYNAGSQIEPPMAMDHDIQVVVFSNHYPEREASKNVIAAQILSGLKGLMSEEGRTPRYPKHNLSAWVWVLLQNGGFAKT